MPGSWKQWKTTEFTSIKSHTLSTAPLWAQELFLGALRAQFVARMRAWWGPERRVRRVVDLGCGSGEWTLLYLELGDRVVGVDFNPHFLAHARAAAAAHAEAARAEFVEADLLDYDELDGTDLVCLGACVQYIDDQQLDLLLGRLRSRLAPGASLYLRTTVAASLRPSHRTELGHYRSEAYYDERLRRFGFKLDDSFRTSAVLPAGLVTRLLGLPSFRTARLISLPLWAGHAAWRSLACTNDYVNWFCTRAET